MNDNYIKFEFKIKLLCLCHGFNGDSVYNVSVYEIYSTSICHFLTFFVTFPTNDETVLAHFQKKKKNFDKDKYPLTFPLCVQTDSALRKPIDYPL